jgi:ribosome maturation factor RimP
MLELHEWLEDLRLEISSPGINRTLKRQEEFTIFEGRGVRLKIDDTWVGGIIAGTTEDELILRQGAEQTMIPFRKIRKAKLDYSQEE